MIKLTKKLTREHSLFYCHVWQQSNQHDPDQPHIMKNILFLKKSQTNKIAVYYDFNELDRYYEIILQKLSQDLSYINKIKETFYDYFNKLLPYIKEKEIKNMAELKEFYNNWIKWWTQMALIFVIFLRKEYFS